MTAARPAAAAAAAQASGARTLGLMLTVVQLVPVALLVLTVFVPYLAGVAEYGGHEGLVRDPDGPHDPQDIMAKLATPPGGVVLIVIALTLVLFLDSAAALVVSAGIAALALTLAASGGPLGLARRARGLLVVSSVLSLTAVALFYTSFGTDVANWIYD
jgi:small-conductance mechanosensitive channel